MIEHGLIFPCHLKIIQLLSPVVQIQGNGLANSSLLPIFFSPFLCLFASAAHRANIVSLSCPLVASAEEDRGYGPPFPFRVFPLFRG
jgi:hypothetical protein